MRTGERTQEPVGLMPMQDDVGLDLQHPGKSLAWRHSPITSRRQTLRSLRLVYQSASSRPCLKNKEQRQRIRHVRLTSGLLRQTHRQVYVDMGIYI